PPRGVRRAQGGRRGPRVRPCRVGRPGPPHLPRRRDAQGGRPQAARPPPRLGHRRRVTSSMSRGPRLVLIALLVVAVAWLGFRAARALDSDRPQTQDRAL